MIKKKVSIIVPVYNCENHIGKCIDSLIDQTYKNIEIIVIDDGSIDRTVNIVRRKSNRNLGSIVLLSQEHGGVSKARNKGLKAATGEYISFVDADDYLEKNYIQEMLSLLIESSSDIAICSYFELEKKRKKMILLPWNHGAVLDKTEIKHKLIPLMIAVLKSDNVKHEIRGLVWRTLINIKLIMNNKIRFDEDVIIAEDLLFCIEAYAKSNQIITVNKCLYNYVKHENSSLERYKDDYIEISKIFHEKFIVTLHENGIFEANLLRYKLNRFGIYTVGISNICRGTELTYMEKRVKILEIVNRFQCDQYMNRDMVRALCSLKKIAYFLFLFKCSHLLFLLFILKEKYRLSHKIRNGESVKNETDTKRKRN